MKKWLAYWCSEGFEYIGEISQYEHWDKEILFDILRNQKPKPNPLDGMINNMRMRALFNNQRNYEIYAFTSTDDLELPDLKTWSDEDPKSFVNWIRGNGIKIYSDRASVCTKVIV